MLPAKWCIKVTNANKEILSKWRTDGDLSDRNYNNLEIPFYLHTPMEERDGYNKQGITSGYLEISFQEFEQYVLNKPVVNEDMSYLEKLLKRWNIR